MANDAWTPSVLNKMKAFLTRGMSTAEIGKKIGMSKNAVVGKLNRLGWNLKSREGKKPPVSGAKPKAAAKKSAPVKKPAPKKAPAKAMPKKAPPPAKKPAKAAPAPKPKAAKPNSKTLAMHQRIIQHSLEMAALKPDQCRWPIGDPDSENFHFCGRQVFVGKPYCYDHCLQAYQMQPPKKK